MPCRDLQALALYTLWLYVLSYSTIPSEVGHTVLLSGLQTCHAFSWTPAFVPILCLPRYALPPFSYLMNSCSH